MLTSNSFLHRSNVCYKFTKVTSTFQYINRELRDNKHWHTWNNLPFHSVTRLPLFNEDLYFGIATATTGSPPFTGLSLPNLKYIHEIAVAVTSEQWKTGPRHDSSFFTLIHVWFIHFLHQQHKSAIDYSDCWLLEGTDRFDLVYRRI